MSSSPPGDERQDAGVPFVKVLGLWDVVAMNIVAVVGLRWVARSARVGAPSVLLWVLACIAFFVPLASVLAHLASRFPDQGGLYVWVRRAFGPVHGFICGWCLWVNNLFYFPSLLLFAAANAAAAFGPRFATLGDSRAYSAVFVLVVLWALVGLNIVGLSAGKRLQNVGSVATWVPAVLLIGCGVASFVLFGSATSFAPAALVPQDDFWATVSLWSAMCFAFSGFEIGSFVGQEIRDPRRTIPLAIGISGIVVTVIYILGSASILVALRPSMLVERSGITEAVDLVTGKVGLAGFGALTGALLAIGAIGGTSSWIAGAARVPFAAGVDHVMPAAFARLHPRYRTPHVSLLAQGAAASLLFLASVFLTLTGAGTNVQEAYDILVNVTILIYFVPYLYLFPAALRLERGRAVEAVPAVEFAFTVPGGRPVLFGLAVLGFVATAVSVALVFIPPAGTTHVVNYETNLVAQSALILAIGAVFYWRARRR